MPKYLYIDEDTGARIGLHVGGSYSAKDKARYLIKSGAAERVLVLEVVSRHSKRVEVEVDDDSYPELPEEAPTAIEKAPEPVPHLATVTEEDPL